MKRNTSQTKQAKQRYKEYKRNQKPNIFKILALIILLIFIIVIGIRVCNNMNIEEGSTQFSEGDLVIEKVTDTQTTEETEVETAEVESEEVVEVELSELEIEEIVDGYIDSMNIEARVGQLFFITPEELTGIGIAVQAGETTKTMMKTYQVGGVLLSEQNFEVIDQIRLMVSNMKVYSSTPLFVAIDESGALRITNTKDTLEDTGLNMASIEGGLYLLTEDGNESIEELNVVSIDDGSIIELVENGANIIIADHGFEDAYDTLVKAVRNGDIEEEVLEESVRKVLTYKVKNGI